MSETADSSPIVDPIVARAHQRWLRLHKRETTARDRWLKDLKFAHGDAYNNWQWPDGMAVERGKRPTLTVNETQQHNLHIKNEAKQNKAQVHYRPTGAGASVKAAEVYEGIYRHIENISNAQMAQGVAIDFQVDAGLGYTILRTKYVSDEPEKEDDPFEQEIYICAASDPLSVLLDGDELDGSDARYGFIFADKPRDAMEVKYPWLKGRMSPQNAVDGGNDTWMTEDTVREAEYYEITETPDELLMSPAGTSILRSELVAKGSALTAGEWIKQWEEESEAAGGKLKRRRVVRKKVKCYTIVGDQVVDETDLPGKSVPIVPWVGTVTVINGELDRKGHTRTMISAQQMTNYNWSASVEYGALQTKTPYIGPMKAFEELQGHWDTINTQNKAWVPYNHVDDMGNPIPAPTRVEPPMGAPVYMEGVQLARQFMLSASGQYEAEMGAPGNEKSGKAINERQRQGDRATYHFIDHQALSIRRQGQIILEWVPEIYDTKRVLRIIGEDGTESHVQLDPAAAQAHQEAEIEGIAGIFNPNVGRYEVVSDVGPDYATQRQETFDALVQILTQAPQLIDRVGDLLFQGADFPLADKIAERLKPGLPAEAQQQIMALQVQLQKAEKAGADVKKTLGEAFEALTELRVEKKNDDQDAVVNAFKADTDRMKVASDMLKNDPTVMAALQPMIAAMVMQVMRQNSQDNLGPVVGHLTNEVTAPPATDEVAGAPVGLPLRVPNVGEQAAMPGGM